MDCEQALALLVADVDREIESSERALLQAHMKECAECRATADAYRSQDADLRRTFAPRRQAAVAVADRVIAQLRATPVTARRHISWLPMLVSAAAGFLIAVGVFRPWEKTPAPVPTSEEPKETVLLAVANEAVEFMAPGSDLWQALKSGEAIAIGSRVRTGPLVRCEFRTSDGSEIRLNSETELLFDSRRRLELSKGQIMARVAQAASAFQVSIADATITALATEFDLLCQPVETVLTVLEGTTEVSGKGDKQLVRTGQAATIAKGKVIRTEQVRNMVQITSWAEEILIRKGRDNPELEKRLNDILAQMGAAKGEFMEEHAIRALGDHCVLPLTRYIQSSRSQGHPDKRHMAARIVADLAQPWSIGDLIQLLKDKDPEIRFEAALGLQRLTKQTFDREPAAWRQPWSECAATYKQWQDWWQQNKQLYPGVSPEAPKKAVEKRSKE